MMNEDEVRRRPLDTGATPPAPPDRFAAPRRRRVGSTVMVVVAGVTLVGGLLSIPAPDGRAEKAADYPSGRPMAPAAPSNVPGEAVVPSGRAVASSFAIPSVSQAYVTVSPGPKAADPNGPPPRDAPLPRSGTCPPSVDPMRLPIHDPWDATTWPKRVTAVTLCRYAQSSFDTSEGHNTLTRGPVKGDLATFRAALKKALPPVRPINHAGCRIANPGPPYTLDIVFVTASRNTGKAYVMLRTLCDPPWREDPQRSLEKAVDAALGPPY